MFAFFKATGFFRNGVLGAAIAGSLMMPGGALAQTIVELNELGNVLNDGINSTADSWRTAEPKAP